LAKSTILNDIHEAANSTIAVHLFVMNSALAVFTINTFPRLLVLAAGVFIVSSFVSICLGQWRMSAWLVR
jgi:hypothetical protein